MGHRFDPTILREYDIRGVVGETLSSADARAIGRAYAVTLGKAGGRRVAIGYDGRLTSPELEAALVEGFVTEGADVVRIGLGPTPMLYYAAATLGVDGGVMVTGSHNPPDYNGFKFVFRGKPFYGAQILELGEIALGLGDPHQIRGQVAEHPIRGEYIARLPGRHVLLNEVIDGTFPAHHPDPALPENLVQLQQAVADEHCDLGIAFDGDGDRIGVVDGRGRILWGDQLIVVLARDVLARHPGAPIIADVKASQVLFDEIARMKGRPVMAATGHSLIKAKLAEIGAPLAGEMSGHIFFADGYYGFDDAVYVAVRLLAILSRTRESLAELRDRLPVVFNTPELRFPCAETRKFEVVREVQNRMRKAGADMTDIDGVRVRTADGWWLLRASNTQAVLVARAESATEDGLARLKKELAFELGASGVALPDI